MQNSWFKMWTETCTVAAIVCFEKLPKHFSGVFLISNHRLPIGTGSWSKFPQYKMFCELCNKYRIADEYHY